MEEEARNVAREAARAAPQEQISLLLHNPREDVLLGLLDNPYFDEKNLCILLLRKELSASFVEQVASHALWLRNYAVRRGLAFHPHLPHSLGLRLVRELFVTDLVQLTMAASAAPALKQLAEELVLARLPQLPPAQKMILARRGSARITGALLSDGQPEVVPIVLESPFLNEGQVLRVLSRINAPSRVVAAIAASGRWTQHYSIRLALVRNPQTPLATVLSFLPSISAADLRILAESSSVPSNVRPHVRGELANRTQHGAQPTKMNRLRPK
ncbi:MAG: hypothetical protein WBQ34_07080 [Candidatus Acidiferrales bacterium]